METELTGNANGHDAGCALADRPRRHRPLAGFVSVTEALSPYSDFSTVNPEVLEAACLRGTRVHKACENIARGFPFLTSNIEPDDCGYIQSFRIWFESTVEEVFAVEPELADQTWGFCGHPDLICRIKGDSGLTVVDYKTPQGLNRSWAAQLAAYLHLANANGIECTRALSVRLRRSGGLALAHEYTNTANDLRGFLGALAAYRFFIKGE